MKIDKKMLESIAALPDEKLLVVLKTLLSGMSPSKDADARTLAGIRYVIGELTDADIERACELIALYKKGKKL